MAQGDLIPTGISGLDDILRGGIPKGNVIVVEGAAGTGKTLLGVEFVYRGVTRHNAPGIIVTFEGAPKRLIRDAAGFGWDLQELERQNTLKTIFTSPQVLSQELLARQPAAGDRCRDGAQRIFIDGISLMRTVANNLNNSGNGNGMGCYRQILQQLLEGFQRENLTAILSHEVTSVEQQAFALEVTEFLTDTVIVLRREQNRRGTHRSLEVTKSRGQDYDAGRHTLRITAGKGLEVFRRVQAPSGDLQREQQPTSSTRQSVIGSAPLDELFGGGVFDGSITMVVGISGSGKTVLGTQLLLEGVKNQKRGLMVSLDEHPEQVMRNAETLGLNLRQHLESGAIQFFYECPRELEIGRPLRAHHPDHRRAQHRTADRGRGDELHQCPGGEQALSRVLPRPGELLQTAPDDDLPELREPRAVRREPVHAGLSGQLDRGQHRAAELRGAEQHDSPGRHGGQGPGQCQPVRDPRVHDRAGRHLSRARGRGPGAADPALPELLSDS